MYVGKLLFGVEVKELILDHLMLMAAVMWSFVVSLLRHQFPMLSGQLFKQLLMTRVLQNAPQVCTIFFNVLENYSITIFDIGERMPYFHCFNNLFF